ncbi:zinc finger protein 11 isoform X1 [Drosophila bipectinata]|uniref:zinc finger protein 11 isoform X1 n=1 Tax=Drosophila bipectinata TaxID=42026 RepID=UPI001C898138|nr:zinc finger protein 569 [Drosophila bipectinata]
MSENQNKQSCLHCRVFNPKFRYQEIFDEFGTELGLQSLLAKHFDLNVTQDCNKQQLLCEVCVNSLIRLFDIDELQREQDALKNKTKTKESAPEQQVSVAIQESSAPPSPTVDPAKKEVAPPKTKTVKTVLVAPKRELIVRIDKEPSTPPQIPPASSQDFDKVKEQERCPLPVKVESKRVPKESDQEQISRLIRNILNDDEVIVEEVSHSIPVEVEKNEGIVLLDSESIPDTDLDQEEFIYDHEDILDPVLPDLKLKTETQPKGQEEDSQSEGDDGSESSNVILFNFVEIKDHDDVGNIFEYLSTVVKTSFEKLSFEWCTDCKHCSQKFQNFESLFSHMLKAHKSRGNAFRCPLKDCSKELKGSQFLAMHLVLMHAQVAEIPIYGSCPECRMTFSNILQYNKHSCAHVIKKKRGVRLYCEMCAQEFPSWKRFNFHNQFHLEKHRPRNCFICDYASKNIDELFQHLNYFHEPEGTLFCDICDRTFRDPEVFTEHNKSHANIGGSSFTCSECMASFESRGRLYGHMRAMHGSAISCELCSREFATEATYNIHMKKHLIIERDVNVCTKCGQLSDNLENMQAHVHNKESPCFQAKVSTELLRDAYTCEHCSLYFKEKDDLQRHRKTGVHKNGLYWCQPCGKEFSHMKLYRHHIRNFQQIRGDATHRKLEICVLYMCDQEDCSEAYANWNSLYTHKRRTHESSSKQAKNTSKPEQEWVCQFCLKQCRSKMSLSVHVARSHNNDNVVCALCNASYKNQEALDKHHAYWHEPIECPQCFKIVKNRRNYDTHVNVVHSNTKRYACSVCQKGFYHKSEMESHQRLHGQSYNCDQCSFTTRNKKSLSVHVLGQHYKRFAFECMMCHKRFGRQQGLNTHMQRAHGSTFTCREYFEGGCGRSFLNSSQLNVHVRKVHNGTIFLTEEEEEEFINDGPSTSKKRCFRIDDDTHIEFVEDADTTQDGMEVVDEIEEDEFEDEGLDAKN